MSSRSYFLVSFLFLVVLSGSAFGAGEILWDGKAGDYMYCNPENWDTNAVPEVNVLAWETGAIGWGDLNDAFIDDPYLASPVIIDDTCSPPPCAKLVVGGDSDVPGVGLEISGGEFQTFELLMGYRASGSGTVHMTGGIINMLDYSYIGVGDGGSGTLIMDGGEINCHLSETCAGEWIDWAGRLMIPKNEQGSKARGHLQLNGGIIRCIQLEMKEGGTADIAGGMLVITMPDHYWGDQREVLAGYMTDGVIYAYGGDPRAEVMGVDDDETGYYIISGYQYSLGQAYNPSPGFCVRDVSPHVTELSWSPGDYADSHDLYFGTDKEAVENATPVSDEYIGTLDVNSCDMPVESVLGKIYYWRVDEVNESDESIVKGLTWNFRIQRHIVVDDFDSYGLYIDPIEDVWSDYSENGTRAEIYLETADSNFIIDGNSMKYRYRNSFFPYYSESTRIFSPSMDWVTGSIRALSLWFHGELYNAAERLYLRVTDSPGNAVTIVYEDSNDLIQEPGDAWHEWNIDLSELSSAGVDLNDINGITIGLGDGVSPGGDGYVYFEDIRLYPRRCRWDISHGYGDVTGDCSVDHYDVEVMGRDWLAYDYNTVDYPAVLENYDDPDSAWRPGEGKIGGALHFAGGGSPDLSWEPLENVAIPPLNLWEPDANGVTISAWIKPEGEQYDFSGIVFCRDGPEGSYGPGDTCGGLSITNSNGLKYHWHDEYWNFNPNLTAPDETWSFVALVVTPIDGTIWLDDGTGLKIPAVNMGTHEVEAFAGITRIGEDEKDEPRHFKGLIDDVRIYRYALDQSQIEQLAGLTGEPSPAPMVRYELDETSGTIAPDTGTSETVYHPLESPANLYDEEPQYHKFVNFRDYCIMADNWLATEMLWP